MRARFPLNASQFFPALDDLLKCAFSAPLQHPRANLGGDARPPEAVAADCLDAAPDGPRKFVVKNFERLLTHGM